jgi:type III secretion protein O
MNVLSDLLRIKIFREQKAEMVLARAKAKLQEAEVIMDSARQTLQIHLDESKRKEELLFADLYIRLVRIKDIDSVALDMTLIKEETVNLENKLSVAKESRLLAQDAEDEAKMLHRIAVRNREKFTEIVELQAEEIKLESQRLEDLEMEESSSSRHSRGSPFSNNTQIAASA